LLDTQPAPPAARTRRPHVQPTGEVRTFSPDELIVSKTDLRGAITYANDVFERVSGYGQDELIGQPHNVIRHPDMPKVVFRLLWDTIAAGQELFAYVNNLASDGASYWVLAHVTPSYGADGKLIGYHSNRRSPSRAAVERVEPVYAQLVAVERAQPSGKAALEASGVLLEQLLAERGETYEDFVWSIINGAEN
jgi:PAS domain S-box-containing protein